MFDVKDRSPHAEDRLRGAASLQNGDRLRSREFLRRYEALPELKKAELVEGVVYMGSPVSAEHGEPDGLIHTWLGLYAAHTPGVRFFSNTTVILDAGNTPQPDACLCLKPGRGGRTRITARKYLEGPPELIVEVSASRASIDLHDKKDAYARNGVAEYLVWRTLERRCDWFVLQDQHYVGPPLDTRGLLRCRVFPGLVLDVRALLAMNASQVLAVLQRGLASSAHRNFLAGL